MSAYMKDANVKAATIRIELEADSGYSASTEGRISADQYWQICAIVNGEALQIQPDYSVCQGDQEL